MNTVTMWSVPIALAKRFVGDMKSWTAEMLMDNEPVEAIQEMLYTIKTIEADIEEAEKK